MYQKEDVLTDLKVAHYLQRFGYFILAKLTTVDNLVSYSR